MGAMVEAPLTCLHYESRGSLSDVLCGAIRIVLYARDGPFVWRKASRKFSGGHHVSIKRGSSTIHFRFARYSFEFQLVILEYVHCFAATMTIMRANIVIEKEENFALT